MRAVLPLFLPYIPVVIFCGLRALSALSRGYRIFRAPFAKRIGIDADELDARVTEIIRTWLEAMARPPAANQGDDVA